MSHTQGFKVLRYRLVRLRAGITLGELSHTTGISTQYISSIELLERQPHPEIQEKLARGLEKALESRKRDADRMLRTCHEQRKRLFEQVMETEGGQDAAK